MQMRPQLYLFLTFVLSLQVSPVDTPVGRFDATDRDQHPQLFYTLTSDTVRPNFLHCLYFPIVSYAIERCKVYIYLNSSLPDSHDMIELHLQIKLDRRCFKVWAVFYYLI